MRQLDPRLLREVRPARRYVAVTAAVGVGIGGLVVAQALLLAVVIADVVGGGQVRAVSGQLGWLAVVVAGRAALAWVQERYGDRAATAVIADLRGRVLAHAVALGPAFLGTANRSGVTTLLSVGLENLRPYLTRYLPQLLSTALITPGVLLVIAVSDALSAVIIAVTLPLVPVFMALVGAMTQDAAARRLASMQRLRAQVLDLLVGLPTLVALGREQGPAAEYARWVTPIGGPPTRPCGRRSCPRWSSTCSPRCPSRWWRWESGCGCCPGPWTCARRCSWRRVSLA